MTWGRPWPAPEGTRTACCVQKGTLHARPFLWDSLNWLLCPFENFSSVLHEKHCLYIRLTASIGSLGWDSFWIRPSVGKGLEMKNKKVLLFFPPTAYMWYRSMYCPRLPNSIEIIPAYSPPNKQMSNGCGVWRWLVACCSTALRGGSFVFTSGPSCCICVTFQNQGNFLWNTQAAKYLDLQSYCGPLLTYHKHGSGETELSKVWLECQLFTLVYFVYHWKAILFSSKSLLKINFW